MRVGREVDIDHIRIEEMLIFVDCFWGTSTLNSRFFKDAHFHGGGIIANPIC